MTEQFIYEHIKQRTKDLGYSNYRVSQRDLTINADAVLKIKAFNQFYYILQADPGLSISSENGEYDKQNPMIEENVYDHTGVIEITNNSDTDKSIQFIYLILIN
jgi:hypothetical protein